MILPVRSAALRRASSPSSPCPCRRSRAADPAQCRRSRPSAPPPRPSSTARSTTPSGRGRSCRPGRGARTTRCTAKRSRSRRTSGSPTTIAIIYIAFRCDDPEAARIKTSITRRDNIWSDDWVGLSLDALGTGQVAYHMMVNPSGVQLDMLQTNSGGEDPSPDWVWDSAGRVDEHRLHRRDPAAAAVDPLQGRRRGADGRAVLAPRQPHRLLGVVAAAQAERVGLPAPRAAGVRSACAAARRARRFPSVDLLRARRSARRRRRGRVSTAPRRSGFSGKVGLTSTITARRDRQPRLQPGRERRLPGRGQPALPGLLLGEAAVLHGGRRAVQPRRRRRRRRQHDLRGPHAAHRRSDCRRARSPARSGRTTSACSRAVDQAAGRDLEAGDPLDGRDKVFTIGRAQMTPARRAASPARCSRRRRKGRPRTSSPAPTSACASAARRCR